MSDITASSVSKGVFVSKGKKRTLNGAIYFGEGSTKSHRYNVLENSWDHIDSKIQMLQEDLHAKIFSDLIEHIKNQYSGSTVLNKIPTAALITGVNIPDHTLIFTSLTSMLLNSVSPHVVVLSHKDCANMKSLLSKIISQLLLSNSNIEDLEDDDDENNPYNSKQIKRVHVAMGVVLQWYKDLQKKNTSGSPKKKHRKPPKVKPIVLLFDNVEGMSANVLQDFVETCSTFIQQLPLFFIFGVATSVSTLQKIFPSTLSTLLTIMTFTAPLAFNYLTHVIDEVIMTHTVPFKIGDKVFSLLVDIFLYHDFSVLNFLRALQFCLLDHFESHKYSTLCLPLSDGLVTIDSLSDEQLEMFITLPSFKQYIENKSANKKAKFKQPKYTKKKIVKYFKRIHKYHVQFFPVLKSLHVLAIKLPKYPLGKQIRELYARSLSDNIVDSDVYSEALVLFKSFSRSELLDCITKINQIFTESVIGKELEERRITIENFKSTLEDDDALNLLEKEREEKDQAPPVQKLPKKTDMYTLRKTLLAKIERRMSGFEILRNNIVNFLDQMFRAHLTCPSQLILHEIFYYNDLASIKSHINGSPRTNMQIALSNPYHYLKNDLCKSEAGIISPGMPDICIIYKLHLECGRFINLYDWLQAFITIVDVDENSNTRQRKKPNPTLQARFIQAVSELQLLGFIKPTKRKTDHVARLTCSGY